MNDIHQVYGKDEFISAHFWEEAARGGTGDVWRVDRSTSAGCACTALPTSTETKIGNCPMKLSAR